MLCLVVVFGVGPSVAMAQGSLDRILRRNGSNSGEITKITSQEVVISRGGVESRVPAEEIRSVYFAGEPANLNRARLAVAGGELNEAVRLLGGIDRQGIDRDEILQDLDFYQALCSAKLALAGQGNLDEATRQVARFLSQHRSSFHVPEAIELSGDLLLSGGKDEQAHKQYALLAKARSPIYKMRAALLLGRLLQRQGKHDEALAEFDGVLQADSTHPLAQRLKIEAELGKAVGQAATGDGRQAIGTVRRVIADADPEDAELHAKAYDALGDCYLSQDNQKGALYAFLHVELLYPQEPTLHAKALHELVGLWEAQGFESRGKEAQQVLEQQYPGISWGQEEGERENRRTQSQRMGAFD